MSAVLPLAYGYLRDDLLDVVGLKAAESRLRNIASRLGFEIGIVFHEPTPQTATVPRAFLDMVQECRRAEARAVITASGHMSGMAIPRISLVAVLAERTGAFVWEIDL